MMLKRPDLRHYLVFVGAMVVCGITSQIFKLDIALLVATCALAFAVEKDRSIVSVKPKQVVMPMRKINEDHYACEMGEVLKKSDGWHIHFAPTNSGYGPFGTQQEAVGAFADCAAQFIEMQVRK